MDIVIDFDGTVVSHEFPEVGKEIGSVPVLREIIKNGHNLILFTMRSNIESPVSDDPNIIPKPGNYLSDAIKWFEYNKIPLYGIQTNPKQHTWTHSPKAYGQIIIDDAALGCPLKTDIKICNRPFVDWNAVREILVENGVIVVDKEKIISAYSTIFKHIYFTQIEKGIDSNGWYSNERNDGWLPLQQHEINQLDFRNNNREFRPKSLA